MNRLVEISNTNLFAVERKIDDVFIFHFLYYEMRYYVQSHKHCALAQLIGGQIFQS